MNNANRRRKVLIIPLNWGLGHATRMTVVARILSEMGAEVTVAASGAARRVMECELPHLRFVPLSGFEMKYYRRLPAVLSILCQLPLWFWSLYQDRRLFLHLLQRESFDLIISDNHFGCHSKKHTSIIITHQIRILLPWYLRPFEPLVGYINRRLINRFSECWVPDVAHGDGLSGRLARGVPLGIPVQYAGPLSRLRPCQASPKRWDVLLLLSGPEPMRSRFEHLLRQQLKTLPIKALLIRGTKGVVDQIRREEQHLHVADFLTTPRLQEELCAAQVVVCRSGYSTLMDLQRCKIAAVVVATPGQPEQEYLAFHLNQLGICHAVRQSCLDLKKALAQAHRYHGWQALPDSDRWQNLLAEKLGVPNPTAATAPDVPLDQKTIG
ncbi:MAG: hypothetical protein NZL95_08830 [Chitinophagales bacterium]|nr:hypothetical protein [Chitinophagales bacterium]MDW8428640.1 glycosyltransferase [Chitinophagales bacterium]